MTKIFVKYVLDSSNYIKHVEIYLIVFCTKIGQNDNLIKNVTKPSERTKNILKNLRLNDLPVGKFDLDYKILQSSIFKLFIISSLNSKFSSLFLLNSG